MKELQRESRFWIVGVVMILLPVLRVTVGPFVLKIPITTVEGILYGLIIVGGLAVLDRELGFGLLARITRLRNGRESGSREG